MCDRDILQLFFEDLNQSMSPLKISYRNISSITISCSNSHQVFTVCLLSRHVLLGHPGYPKHQNGIATLCFVKSQKAAGLKTCSISACPSIRRMPNVWTYMVLWHYEGRLISNAHSEIFCRQSIVVMRAQCVLVATTLLHSDAKFHSFLYTGSETVRVNMECVMVVCQRHWSNMQRLNF